MNTHAYNDYVINSSLEAGWITEEQHQSVLTALGSIPDAEALGLMLEQELLDEEKAQMLRDLIAQAEGSAHAEEESVASAEEESLHHAEVKEDSPASEPGSFRHMDDYLLYAMGLKASDLHVGPEAKPICRLNGTLQPLYEGAAELDPRETERLARGFLTEDQIKVVEEIGSVDFCYEIKDKARFRTSVVRQRRGWESVFRIIESNIRTMEELKLPEVMYTLTKYHNGLVLVTGPVGCGKSTTLAAMINHIAQDRSDHIITLEDPAEYIFESAKCQVSQREIHTNTVSFGSALRAALREDPDVIMVGEMRDLETISLAITASETGHLVLGTLHTSTAARTLDRVLDVFPIEQQAQIRTMVSESIRGIVCQQLVPRADGNGRVLALEIMTNTAAVANLIREGKTFMLTGVMQTGKKQGMVLMDESLLQLVQQKIITPQAAYKRAENKKPFAAMMAGA